MKKPRACIRCGRAEDGSRHPVVYSRLTEAGGVTQAVCPSPVYEAPRLIRAVNRVLTWLNQIGPGR